MTLTDPLPAVPRVGVPIGATVVIAVDAADTPDDVLLPVGVTVKVYEVLLASPVTLQL
jgi:hypothetical protein